MASEFAHAIRTAELDLALPQLPPGGKVLELGAGDGWQALRLSSLGFAVTAIDIAPPRIGQHQHYPVDHYDGRTLPLPESHLSFRLFYTGNELLGLRLTISARNCLAQIFGSSTHVFVLRPYEHGT